MPAAGAQRWRELGRRTQEQRQRSAPRLAIGPVAADAEVAADDVGGEAAGEALESRRTQIVAEKSLAVGALAKFSEPPGDENTPRGGAPDLASKVAAIKQHKRTRALLVTQQNGGQGPLARLPLRTLSSGLVQSSTSMRRVSADLPHRCEVAVLVRTVGGGGRCISCHIQLVRCSPPSAVLPLSCLPPAQPPKPPALAVDIDLPAVTAAETEPEAAGSAMMRSNCLCVTTGRLPLLLRLRRTAVPHDGWRERGSRTYGGFTEQLKQRQLGNRPAVPGSDALPPFSHVATVRLTTVAILQLLCVATGRLQQLPCTAGSRCTSPGSGCLVWLRWARSARSDTERCVLYLCVTHRHNIHCHGGGWLGGLSWRRVCLCRTTTRATTAGWRRRRPRPAPSAVPASRPGRLNPVSVSALLPQLRYGQATHNCRGRADMVGVRVPGPICLRPFVAKCNDRRYANDWAQYGVGTYMYFRDLQRLAVLFFAMAIVSLPAMLVNINRDTGETPAPRTPHTSSVDLPRSLALTWRGDLNQRRSQSARRRTATRPV